MRVTALAGGVGAAKFLRGLLRETDPEGITIVGNTGDDEVFHGLHVSPDLDTVAYTLAGVVDASRGWGLAGDTGAALGQMRALGVDAWFTLGDRDIGTHLARTTWLSEGLTLTEATARICSALGLRATLLPMSDDPVRTRLITAAGEELSFQDYFVRRRHADAVGEVRFTGAAAARPAPGVLDAVREAAAVLICPSNPVISIGPILAVPGIRDALEARRETVFAISPIVEGRALKGPAAELLAAGGVEPSAAGVAGLYAGFCGNFVVDRRDASEAQAVEALGVRAIVCETVMDDIEVAASLARTLLAA